MKNRYFLQNTVFIISLLILPVYSTPTHAQQIIHTLEAEDAQLTLPAKIKTVTGYSGNKYVGDNDPGSAITFTNVEIPEEGTYEFRTHYTSMYVRSIAIQSGNYPKIISTGKQTTPDWNKPPIAVMTTYIYLNEGKNTLTITPHGEGGPNIDKFEIIQTNVTMPRPQPVKTAFHYDLTDDAVVTSNATDDQLANITDNDESTVYTFSGASVEIKITCDQPYLLTGYYLSPGPAGLENVKNWKMEYSVDDRVYSVISPMSVNETMNGAIFHVKRNSHADAAKSSQYYRLTAYGGEIGEIQLFGIPYMPNTDNKNFPLDITQSLDIRTATLGDPLGVYQFGSFDERYYNLFDRDMSKKYYWHSSTTFWVDVELPDPAILSHYTLTTCQDYPERDPRSWELQGYDNDWETIHKVTDYQFPTRYATMKFYTQNKKTYKGYRLRVTANNGADSFQLLKWQLFSGNTTSVSQPVDNRIIIYSTQNTITIKSQEKARYHIYNLSGKLITTGEINNTEEKQIPLQQGIYITKLLTAGKSKIEKVIVR